MKILIISQELWTSTNNAGNVLSNMFEGFDAEFAQIYCSVGTPENTICKQYYQMTDFMMFNNIFRKQPVGKTLIFEKFPKALPSAINPKVENKFYKFFRRNHWFVFDVLREVVWKLAKWDNKRLDDFVLKYSPDIIFAPCYAIHFMLSLTRHVADLTNVKVISYISDDNYSLKQFRFSPLFWINKFILRANIRKTFKYYSLTYTMTFEQLSELSNDLGAKMKILRKGCDVDLIPKCHIINDPIRLLYAGNLCCGRTKTLSFIGKKLKKINKERLKIRLDIYTNSELNSTKKSQLNDNINIFLHPVVTQIELRQIYRSSDIALHVESFGLKNRLLTRLSFSTKIVDCLSSGCAVLAIGWKHHSGLLYLRKEDAGFCIDDLNDVEELLYIFIEKPEIITRYKEKALACAEKNHKIVDIQKGLYDDFINLIN